jgi:hypothetical protein
MVQKNWSSTTTNAHAVSDTHKCPSCGGNKVRRTTRIGGLDQILSLVNVYPYRCRQCPPPNRFHKFGRI